MDFSADFTAIDFETANRRRDSACQLAAVVVRGGRIVDQAMWMIRPEPLYFSRGNIEIHGITPEKVRDVPVFGDLWPEIVAKIGDDCLVAHNASFDIGVMMACLRQGGHTVPELAFTCTRAVAKRTWPHRPRFGLKPLADWLGIRFKHHDALEDSVACAKILLAAGIDREAPTLEDLESNLRIVRGRAGDWGYRGPRSITSRSRRSNQSSITRRVDTVCEVSANLPFLYPGQTTVGAASETRAGYTTASPSRPSQQPSTPVMIDVQRLMVRAEFIRPLAGKQVVFTGRLCNLNRSEAELLATRSGGHCQPAVDRLTDLLVVGRSELRTANDGGSTSEKEASARRIQDEGGAIQIVDEETFLGLVISPTVEVS